MHNPRRQPPKGGQVNPEAITHAVLQLEIRQVASDLEEHKADFNEVRTAVFGNGEAGLAEQIRTIQRDIGRLVKMAWPIIVSAVAAASSYIWKTLAL